MCEIDDLWTVDARTRPRVLDEGWTGRLVFQILPKTLPLGELPLGKAWQDGTLTVMQPTQRPPNIWVEVWRRMSPKRQNEPIEAWKVAGPRRDAEYKEASKIKMVPISDFAKYDKLLPEVRNSLCLPVEPAMACVTKVGVNVNISRDARATQECPESLIQHHQDNMQSVGYVSAAYFALVHKAVSRSKVKFIKGAQDAIDK